MWGRTEFENTVFLLQECLKQNSLPQKKLRHFCRKNLNISTLWTTFWIKSGGEDELQVVPAWCLHSPEWQSWFIQIISNNWFKSGMHGAGHFLLFIEFWSPRTMGSDLYLTMSCLVIKLTPSSQLNCMELTFLFTKLLQGTLKLWSALN